MSSEEIKSILLIRLSAIGDIIMASGVLPALKSKYPDARIDWLVQPECRDLLSATSRINEVIVWQRKEWVKMLKQGKLVDFCSELLGLARKLRSRDYDLVIDMQGLWKSGIWAFLSSAGYRIGLGSREGSSLLMDEVISLDRSDASIASEYKLLLKEMGIENNNYGLGIEVSPEDDAVAGNKLSTQLGDSAYIVVCPFTTRAQKHWPQERWVELIQDLQGSYKMPVALLGGPGDMQAAERLQRSCPGLINCAGTTSLRQSLAMILNSSLVIGVDTGLTHVGSLSSVPTVALFGSTCPYLENGNPGLEVIYKQFSCSPCRRKPTCTDFPCMRAIQVEDVLERIKHLQVAD